MNNDKNTRLRSALRDNLQRRKSGVKDGLHRPLKQAKTTLKQTILITRPEPQASVTAEQWRKRGYDCIISPAIVQNPVNGAEKMLDECSADAFVLTSRYALRLLASNHFALSKPLYVTGEILAKQAFEFGFKQVHHGDATARSLLAYMAQHSDKSLNYAHLHSNHQAVNMAIELHGLGFRVQGLEIYETQPAQSLSSQAIAALQAGVVDGVLLYSSMSAQSFLQLIAQAGLQGSLSKIQAICLSENIANILPPNLFKQIIPELQDKGDGDGG